MAIAWFCIPRKVLFQMWAVVAPLHSPVAWPPPHRCSPRRRRCITSPVIKGWEAGSWILNSDVSSSTILEYCAAARFYVARQLPLLFYFPVGRFTVNAMLWQNCSNFCVFLSPLPLSHGAVLCGPPDTINTDCSAGFIPPQLRDKHTYAKYTVC